MVEFHDISTVHEKNELFSSTFYLKQTMSTILNEYKIGLLIAGYVRNTFNSQIPEDIINLFTLFWSSKIYWNIPTNTIKNLEYSINSEVDIDGPKFEVNGIKFICKLQKNKNTWSAEKEETIRFGIALDEDTEKYKEILFTINLYCDETQTEYRRMYRMQSSNFNVNWPRYALHLKESNLALLLHKFIIPY